jgi:hypothetical protein
MGIRRVPTEELLDFMRQRFRDEQRKRSLAVDSNVVAVAVNARSSSSSSSSCGFGPTPQQYGTDGEWSNGTTLCWFLKPQKNYGGGCSRTTPAVLSGSININKNQKKNTTTGWKLLLLLLIFLAFEGSVRHMLLCSWGGCWHALGATFDDAAKQPPTKKQRTSH